MKEGGVRKIEDYFLIKKIKKGDSDAWEKLVGKYYQQIFEFCVRSCFGNRVLASDLTQDIFLKLVENIDSYKFTGKFSNYLFTITINTCRNNSKKKQLSTQEFVEDYIYLTVNKKFSKSCFEKIDYNLIQDALNQLSDSQKEAIILKFYHGFKVKEIAKVTNTSVPTAQSRINQGLKKLEKKLDRKDFKDV